MLEASSSYLSRLDRVQHSALGIIGPGAILPSLAIRRTVAALACLYKLQVITGPPQVLAVLPARRQQSANPRTRSDNASAAGHQFQLDASLPASTLLVLKRSFPHCVLHQWNALPCDLLLHLSYRSRMQAFITQVYRYLRAENWMWATDSV